ncbi:HdeD family acid-resistance protein [Sunxiuqinia sp. sy24]|uniref:HdeD family acid-resistance protein n=1 Tax=Sunxiuqinia sp. sy24 TaxID=3461495 RepID=UPI004046270D
MKIQVADKRSFSYVRAVVMMLLGLALLFYPGFTLLSITRFVAVLLLVKGAMSGLVLFLSKNRQGSSSFVFELLFDVGVGLLILYNPGGTISFFVIVMAIWALLGGLLMAFSFTSLRKAGINNWGLFLSSVIALSFGLVLIFEPLRSGLALATVIGVFALVYGFVSLLSVLSPKSA